MSDLSQNSSPNAQNPEPLPAYITALMERISALEKSVTKLEEENKEKDSEIDRLNGQLDWYRRNMFGRKSEASRKHPDDPNQMSIYDLLGIPEEKPVEGVSDSSEEEKSIKVDSYTRKKGSRDPKRKQEELLAKAKKTAPQYIYATDDEKVCPRCGSGMSHLGWEFVRTEVHVIPAQVVATEIYKEKVYCEKCKADQDVFVFATAFAPPALIPGSYASADLIAYVGYEKYQMGTPNYRLEQHFALFGIVITRGSMCTWLIISAEKYLFIIYEYLHHQYLIHRDIINADETVCPVNKIEELVPLADENGWPLAPEVIEKLTKERDERAKASREEEAKQAQAEKAADENAPEEVKAGTEKEPAVKASSRKKCYLWLYASVYGTDKPIKLYDYQPSRAGENCKNFLGADYSGFLITDGCGAYNKMKEAKRQSCMDHIRRKWYDAIRVKSGLPDYSDPAVWPFMMINQVYRIEKELAPLNPDERKAERLRREAPIWKKFKEHLDQMDPSGGSLLQTAVNYTQKQWDKAMTYLQDGRVPLSNNAVERCAKSYATARKNFLFHDTSRGARSGAIWKSLIDTAAANDLNPELYMTQLLLHARDYEKEPARAEEYMPWSDKMKALCSNISKQDSGKAES